MFLLTQVNVTNPLIFFVWFLILAAGCFGGIRAITPGGNAYWGWGGGVCLFLAILALKLFTF
jgi:hypothetical protein